ncbi:beta-defensin 113 [Callospermophilus lateralis]|uniref:beta-defensin 113 n=1 Tax=Callospermophilus lateralis TaxID=76772 RepID=UPI0040386189
MKIFCIFLIFFFNVFCELSVSQQKAEDKAERQRKCQLVQGVCKLKCNSWEYVFTHCDFEPCCVIREYRLP